MLAPQQPARSVIDDWATSTQIGWSGTLAGMPNHIRATRVAVFLTAAALITAAACSSEEAVPPISTQVQISAPTAATVSSVESELVFDSEAAVSPSGAARVAQSEGTWCLEDASGVRCVAAAAEGSRGGLIWRPDETAIVASWGAQDPISIVDFEAGTSVETDLNDHRLLAWTPDGSSLIGLELDQPGEFRRLDPTTLDSSNFAPFGDEISGVPEMRWVNGVLWGSDPFTAGVFTMSSGDEPDVIEGGIGEQQFESFSADGRYAIARDNDIERGRDEPGDRILHLFDADERRSNGLELPPGAEQDDLSAAQLSADGTMLLALIDSGGEITLQRAEIDLESLSTTSWTLLFSWPAGDPTRPAPFHGKGILRWSGGSTAYAFTDADTLIQIDLS